MYKLTHSHRVFVRPSRLCKDNAWENGTAALPGIRPFVGHSSFVLSVSTARFQKVVDSETECFVTPAKEGRRKL